MDGLVASYESLASGLTDQTATLYKLTKERSTIGDEARSSAIECYLNMCQFNYKLVECSNADYMSPSRMSPFLVIPVEQGLLMFSSFEAIANYIETQGKGVAAGMDTIDKADTMAIASLISSVVIAEQYFTWVHYDTYKKNTQLAVGGDKPWPLNLVIPVMGRVKFIWNNYTLYRTDESQVILSCRQSLKNLSTLLEDGTHSFSTRCPVDALVYGHIQTLRNCGIIELAGMMKDYPNLLEYCDSMTQEHFNIGMVVNEQ